MSKIYRILHIPSATLLGNITYPHFGNLKQAQRYINNLYIKFKHEYEPVRVEKPTGLQEAYGVFFNNTNIKHVCIFNNKADAELFNSLVNGRVSNGYVRECLVPNLYDLAYKGSISINDVKVFEHLNV